MAIKFRPVETVSVTKQIAEQIKSSILDGRLKADDRLPTEHELAEQFGVSRPTIREALKRLAAQNLIHSRRGPSGGTFVRRPREEEVRAGLISETTLLVTLGEFDLTDIAEARHQLERLCGGLAALRRKDEHLTAMRAELDLQQADKLGDEEFCASDVRFHRALVDATENPVLQFVMSTVIEALQPVENLVVFRLRDKTRTIEQHQRILAAVEACDVEGTHAAIDEQMTYLRELFAKAQDMRRSETAQSSHPQT